MTSVSNLQTTKSFLRFVHFRNFDSKGFISPFGGLTVGWVNDPSSNDTVLFSLARCSKRDVFNKKKARRICEARMRGGKYYELSGIVDGKIYDQLNTWLVANSDRASRFPVPLETKVKWQPNLIK